MLSGAAAAGLRPLSFSTRVRTASVACARAESLRVVDSKWIGRLVERRLRVRIRGSPRRFPGPLNESLRHLASRRLARSRGGFSGAFPREGSTSSCVIAIPKRISLVCFPFCAQADVFGNIASGALGGNHRLPTSLNGIIGTNAPKSSLQHLLRREPARIRCHPFGSRVSGVLSVTSSLSFTPQGFAHGSSSVPVARWSRLGSVRSSDQRTV
jgi:hypothetical protein